MDYLMYLKTFLLWFDHFLDPWAEICQIFRCFFGKFKKSKKQSEIIWPLGNGHWTGLLSKEFVFKIENTKHNYVAKYGKNVFF